MSQTVEIKVEGMSCQNCAKHVTHALEALEGISQVHIDLSTGKVRFNTENKTSADQIAATLDEAGYDVLG